MIRTGYSFKHAVGQLPDVLARIKAIGWPVAPICDRTAFAWATWAKLAKAEGMRPVFGVELPVVLDPTAKKPAIDWWQFYAKTDIRALHNLIATATGDGLTYAAALAAPGVVRVTGSATALANVMPAPNLYVGLSPSLPRALYKPASERGFRFMAMSDNVYPCAADREFYRVALNQRASVQTWPQHILDDAEWQRAVGYADKKTIASALANRALVFDSCTATLQKATMLVPAKPKTLRAMCVEGAKRVGVDLQNKVYSDRLDHELKMIADKKFEDYFYIIAEMVNWAKQRMIVGPARGSSCGSLACYLLNITAIDPIPHGLLFERFIDVTRSDLPDIDIDFSDANRDLVFRHAEEVYGADHVARLGTVSTWQPRSALKIAGMALKISSMEINKILDSLIERMGGDARANLTLQDTLETTDAGRKLLQNHPNIMIAARMEGHPSNAGQHAAGIVITEKPVSEYIAVDMRTKSVQCDKYDTDAFNLLKIDALGLKQLSVFERTLELMGKPPINGWLENNIPMEDPKAFAILNDEHFAGIFQFNGISLQALSKNVIVTSFNDMIAMTALSRPGPMGTGGATSWYRRRSGKEAATYNHEMLKPFLEETQGIVTYQEQVLRIGHDLGDLSWADVTALRKGMSKSLGQEFFDQYGDKFKIGIMKRGMDKDIADRTWSELCTFGNYGFNKSHAVAYALISYWCCWLKAYYPIEFAAATLDAENDEARQIMLLRELSDEGISYLPVDPAHSTDRWQPIKKGGKRMLVGPLSQVHGIGPAAVTKILEARRTGAKLAPAIKAKLEKPVTKIDSLYPIAVQLKKLHPNGLGFKHPVVTIKSCQCVPSDTRVLIVGVVTKIQPKDLNEALNVAKRVKRGGRALIKGPHVALNCFIKDDTDEIFCRVEPSDYDDMGQKIVTKGRVGKALWGFMGILPKGDFRMLKIERVRYLGDLEGISFEMNIGGKNSDTPPGETDGNKLIPVPGETMKIKRTKVLHEQ